MLKYLAAMIFVIVAACTPSSQSTIPTPQAAFLSPLSGRYTYFMPVVVAGLPPQATPTRTIKPTATPVPCFRSAQAAEFYRLMATDARQQRVSMTCDARLVAAAEARANAQFGDGLSHTDANGVTPNAYVRHHGCRLPSFYPIAGNSVESLTAGAREALNAFESLARSPRHSEHIFGIDKFFQSQLLVGVAMVEKPELKYRYYWAIITAECVTLTN
jgi:hypothetical protein